MKQLKEDIEYIGNILTDLYSASNGEVFAEISKERFDAVIDFLQATTSDQLTNDILLTVHQLMVMADDLAAAPNAISEIVYELVVENLREDIAERIADSLSNFADELVEDIGKYK